MRWGGKGKILGKVKTLFCIFFFWLVAFTGGGDASSLAGKSLGDDETRKKSKGSEVNAKSMTNRLAFKETEVE